MRHSDIARAATAAFAVAHGLSPGGATFVPQLRALYAYCRERNFPPAETLARRFGAEIGHEFPWPSLEAAPEPTRASFIAFRAVAQALEPFHQPDQEGSHGEIETHAGEDPAAEAASGFGDPDLAAGAPTAFEEIVFIFREIDDGDANLVLAGIEDNDGNTVSAGTWLDSKDRFSRLQLTVHKSDIHDVDGAPKDPAMDDDSKPAEDEIEARRRAAQAEAEKVISESGGKFSADETTAPKTKSK